MEGFSIKKLVFGERPKVLAPERLTSDRTEIFKQASEAAFAADTFDERHELLTNAINNEAFDSARHFAVGVPGNGPWKEGAFWRDVRGIYKHAIDAASFVFKDAYRREGEKDVPDMSPEGEAANDAAFNNPGPSLLNRVVLMEIMARARGPYAYELATNEQYRKEISGRVDEALGKVGLLTLVDIVLDELKRLGFKNLPTEKNMRDIEVDAIYDGIRGTLRKEGDEYAAKLLDKRDMSIGSFSERKNEKNDLFLRLALVGVHATWEAAPVHRDRRKGKFDKMKKDNFKPLPEYLKNTYKKYIAEGHTPENAVLALAFELYKDVRIMRQEDNSNGHERIEVPPAEMFMKAGEERKRRPTSAGKIAATALVAGGVGAIALEKESPEPIPSPASISAPAVTSEIKVGVEAREGSGMGAIRLFDKFLEKYTGFLERYDGIFDGMDDSITEPSHRLAKRFGLWNPETGQSVPVHAHDGIRFNSSVGLIYYHDGREELLMTPDGAAIFPYRGKMVQDRR